MSHKFKCFAHEWPHSPLLFELLWLYFTFHNQYNSIFYWKKHLAHELTHIYYTRGSQTLEKLMDGAKHTSKLIKFFSLGDMGRYTRNDQEEIWVRNDEERLKVHNEGNLNCYNDDG